MDHIHITLGTLSKKKVYPQVIKMQPWSESICAVIKIISH